MALSSRIETVARHILFKRKLAALTTADLAAMLAALTPQQLGSFIALVRADDPERLGKAVAFYVRSVLQAQADTEAATLAAKGSLTQIEVELLLNQP